MSRVATNPSAIAPALAAEYVRPHTLVDIGGRKLNLFCMGTGETTVLFDAGGSDWSVIWALVQPAVARNARACTYDRAGLGYSDSDPGPRTPFAIADDLHKLVRAAELARPLVLVGHSLGGFNVKLYAALYPDDVAGLLLIDPSEERDSDRTRAFITQRWGASIAAQSELSGQRFLTNSISRYRGCAETAEKAPLDPASISYRRCTDPVRPALGPIIAAERAVVQRTAQYQRAQASELANSVYGDPRADSAYANLLRPGAIGDKPLVVLTAHQDDSSDPLDAADFAAGNRLHDETVLLSTSGCRQMVTGTGHNIQIDRPDSVIDAVNRVIRQVNHKARSTIRMTSLALGTITPSLQQPAEVLAPKCAKD
ncbi:MAG: alpha/beta hydrolase [Acidobacteria bacterium]|nr:alpha/beta hydrolase [Acidobacteriota bacterium]